MLVVCLKPLLLTCMLAIGASELRAQTPAGSPLPPEAPLATYQGRSFPRLRTPVPQLPWAGQAEILRLETLLQRAYLGLLADTATVLVPVQADVIEQAARQAAAVVPKWNHEAYHQEAAFYVAEQARRFPTTKKP
jgi:hypothetical protein